MDKKKMGKFIKELREERKLAQWELAEKIGVKRPTITKWELGMSAVSEESLIILSQFFGITVEEIVNGERRKKTLTEKLDETTIKMMHKIRRLNRLLRYFLCLIILLIFAFLAYYFYISYNEIKVYTIHLDSDKYIANYGLLTKTRDKIYFYLDVEYLIDNVDDIELIQLYYNNGNKRNYINQIDNIQPFVFIDYDGYNEFINFDEFDIALNKMYIDVDFKNGTFETIKVEFTRDYSNSNLLPKKEKSMDTKLTTTKAKEEKTKFYERFLKLKKVIEKHGKANTMKFKFEGKDFDIQVDENELLYSYIKDNKEYKFMYNYVHKEIFTVHNVVEGQEDVQIYSFDIQKGKCLEGECTNHMDNYREMLRLYYEIMYVY